MMYSNIGLTFHETVPLMHKNNADQMLQLNLQGPDAHLRHLSARHQQVQTSALANLTSSSSTLLSYHFSSPSTVLLSRWMPSSSMYCLLFHSRGHPHLSSTVYFVTAEVILVYYFLCHGRGHPNLLVTLSRRRSSSSTVNIVHSRGHPHLLFTLSRQRSSPSTVYMSRRRSSSSTVYFVTAEVILIYCLLCYA